MKLALPSLAAAAVLCLSTVALAAPPRSRLAAEGALPGDQDAIATVNVKTSRTSELFKKYFPLLLKEERDVGEGLAKVKSTCGIDPMNAIADVTVGVSEDRRGALFIALDGVSESKMLDCVKKLAKSEAGATLTAKKSGFVTVLSSDKKESSLHFAWLPGDVLVLTMQPEDRAELTRMISGQGSFGRTALGQLFAKVSPDSAIGLAWTKGIRERGVEIQNGTLALEYAAKRYSLTVSAATPSNDEAEKTASLVKMAPAALSAIKGVPKAAEKLAKNLKARADGNRVELSLTADEVDVLSIANWAADRGKLK
jgi:hypothetical protein